MNEFVMKYLDGTPVEPEYLERLYPMVRDAAEAIELLGDDALEADHE